MNMLHAEILEFCWNKYSLNVQNFDADNFILEYKKYMNLPNMQKDLRVYYDSVSSKIHEVINKDYIDYIILSNSILGLEKYIKVIDSSLEKLKGYIIIAKQVLDKTLHLITLIIANKNSVHEMKQNVRHVLFLFEGLEKIKELNLFSVQKNAYPFSVLEANAFCYSSTEFHSSKTFSLKFRNIEKENVKSAFEKIMNQLEYLFLKSISTNDSQSLCTILHIYSLLNKEKYAENAFRQAYVKKYMQEHVTEENVLNNGIEKVYKDILNFISRFRSLFAKEKSGMHTEIARCDFLVNAIWPEVVQQFKNISLINIYAVQDIKYFHRNYSTTMLFLQNFEQNCGTQVSVKRLREHHAYKEFLEKWNIDIYFRIVFLEIAGEFEKTLFLEFQNSTAKRRIDNDSLYMLNSSISLQRSIKKAWDDKVFLLPLIHNFWRLTLQLVSRYNKWAHSFLRKKQEENIMFYETAVALLIDVELLTNNYKEVFSSKIQPHVQRAALKAFVRMAFIDSVQTLKNISLFAETIITESLTEQCCSYLACVRDIPKLFRKTNREVPSIPSEYAVLLSKFIMEFAKQTSPILSKEKEIYFLTYIENTISNQWAKIIHDVLTSVKKTEKSFKILKRAKSKTNSVTDEEKIKHQLKLDVNYIKEFFQQLDIENEENYKILISLILSF